jgi:4-cresol dehydrogenase (hydroxylating)
MNQPNPINLSRFVEACSKLIGKSRVFLDDLDRASYRDAYRLKEDDQHIPSGAIAVESTEQVQTVVRLANQYKIPLWPISRGKNLAYGGSAPRLNGSFILDMTKMKKILTVNEELAYAELEPGVGFYDLHDHLRNNNIKLWASYPEQCWGSVMGNALDRGVGRTPYGDHSQNICGMEIVLPNGELMRTGLGAMSNNRTSALYKNGYGPGFEQMFVQSNYGIVTKVGMWLMPQPEATVTLRIGAPEEADMPWMLEILLKLCREGIIDQYLALINFMPIATLFTQRDQWAEKGRPMKEKEIKKMLSALHLGWWNAEITLYGNREIVAAKEKIVRTAFRQYPQLRINASAWDDSLPLEKSGMSKPTTEAFQLVNWYGGRGAHMDFSPVLPSKVSDVVAYYKRNKALTEEYGRDFHCAMHLKPRHVVMVNALAYNRDDEKMTTATQTLFQQLIETTADQGYGEYRTHLDWMDQVALSYDFNDNAQLKLSETIKDALDPNGIIAPGKSGIWPANFRKGKNT